ncbi:MAG: phosphate acyltransferase, partial [Candidatus Omnitrophota bacterium]
MDAIAKIRERARKKMKSIVLPEYYDKRVAEAARIIKDEGLAKVTLFTEDMVDKSEKERYIQEYYEIYKNKDIDLEAVRKLFEDVLYYAAMMTREGKFDGLVAGAAHTTADVVRSSMRCIGIDERITLISSCFIMAVPDCPYGSDGV